MATPPSNLPSPTPSSSSSHHPQSFSSLSHANTNPPPRAPSVASVLSGVSTGHGGASSYTNGSEMRGERNYEEQGSSATYQPPSGSSHQFQPYHPQFQHQQPSSSASYPPAPFLPPVTASPPTHPPPYIPPPQHAMPPDPIHSLQPGGTPGYPSGQASQSGPGMPSWSSSPGPGPGSQGQPWRANPQQIGQIGGYGYRTLNQSLPNGHHPSSGYQPEFNLRSSSIPPNGGHSVPSGMINPPYLSNIGQPHPSNLGLGMINGHSRSGSAGGRRSERGRERADRSDRLDGKAEKGEDGYREGERGDDVDEIITTIFVVGFPDDMQEREFQNMFTFAPGFEAATLKFPSSSRREPTAALLAELTHLAAAQTALANGEHGEPGSAQALAHSQAQLEEALAALQMGGGHGHSTQSTSSATTPSAAISLTPSAPSNAILGGAYHQSNSLPSLPTRRQTIGFARFRSRAEALAAKESLQGRKIDVITGATLKAEMAKKNLHTKRGIGGEELVGMLLRSGRLAGLMGVPPGSQGLGVNVGMGAGIGGSSGMMPSGNVPPAFNPISPSGMQSGTGAGQSLPSGREAWDSWSNSQQSAHPSQLHRESFEDKNLSQSQAGGNSSLIQQSTEYQNHPARPQASSVNSGQSSSASPPLSITSPNTRPTDSKALLALAEEADELEVWSVGGAMGGIGMDYQPPAPTTRRISTADTGMRSPIPQQLAFQPPTSGSGGMYSIRTNAQAQQDLGNAATAGFSSGSPPDGGLGLGSSAVNPADQNPPINTLYIGNLPAISPPTHPPNFLEESLRGLFQRCPGFKRMSFRQKINGPMCFVEFEEVGAASQAIKDLYGHTLGGLVKGGIRLSYSKNSLGQRGTAYPTGINTSLFGGIAHTVALAGMSSPSPGIGSNQNQPGYPNSNALGTSASAPIPVSSNRYQSGSSNPTERDSTTLSPTAQPFNASLPATSPRSRYFNPPPSASQQIPSASSTSSGVKEISIPNQQSPPNSYGGTQFSPMSSPIRTPGSLSWLSSSAGASSGVPGSGGAAGAGGYGFDPFASHGGMGIGMTMGMGGIGGGMGLGSLNGAASAWGQGQSQNGGH